MGCFSCFTIRRRQAAHGAHAQEFLGKPESIENATPPPKISTYIPEEVGSVADSIEGVDTWCKIEILTTETISLGWAFSVLLPRDAFVA